MTVPQREKDLARGIRCTKEAKNYSGVTADFIGFVLANGKTKRFTKWVAWLQRYYYRGIAGQQNDARIASNFAVLGAGLVVIGRFFGDVWPDWKKEVWKFLTVDLLAVRDDMLRDVMEQQPSEVFLETLRVLISHKRVRLEESGYNSEDQKHIPVIGRLVPANGVRPEFCQISMPLALEAVQNSLKTQGRPLLSMTDKTLLDQLSQDGKLLAPDGQPLANNAKGSLVKRVRVNKDRPRCFAIDPAELCPWRVQTPSVPRPTKPTGKESVELADGTV